MTFRRDRSVPARRCASSVPTSSPKWRVRRTETAGPYGPTHPMTDSAVRYRRRSRETPWRSTPAGMPSRCNRSQTSMGWTCIGVAVSSTSPCGCVPSVPCISFGARRVRPAFPLASRGASPGVVSLIKDRPDPRARPVLEKRHRTIVPAHEMTRRDNDRLVMPAIPVNGRVRFVRARPAKDTKPACGRHRSAS